MSKAHPDAKSRVLTGDSAVAGPAAQLWEMHVLPSTHIDSVLGIARTPGPIIHDELRGRRKESHACFLYSTEGA